MSATPSRRPRGPDGPGGNTRAPRGGRYHHGDLKAALADGAVELIGERGVRGFSLAELSRRLGVTVAAPYRHFTDRDELLAAVAARALHAFADALAAESDDRDPPELRLAAMARGYVRFAAEQRPLFDAVYATDLDKSRYPELASAYERIDEPFSSCVARLCPDDAEAAAALEDALEASARGHAALLLEGSYGEGPDAIDRAAARAARTTVALIEGFGIHAATPRSAALGAAEDDLTSQPGPAPPRRAG
jgi:AcrR family transcriptional regulator